MTKYWQILIQKHSIECLTFRLLHSGLSGSSKGKYYFTYCKQNIIVLERCKKYFHVVDFTCKILFVKLAIERIRRIPPISRYFFLFLLFTNLTYNFFLVFLSIFSNFLQSHPHGSWIQRKRLNILKMSFGRLKNVFCLVRGWRNEKNDQSN